MDVTKETKSSLVDKIHEKTDYKLNDIKNIVDLFLEETMNSIIAGNSVEFRGFGVFNVTIRKARKNVRNPRTVPSTTIEATSTCPTSQTASFATYKKPVASILPVNVPSICRISVNFITPLKVVSFPKTVTCFSLSLFFIDSKQIHPPVINFKFFGRG